MQIFYDEFGSNRGFWKAGRNAGWLDGPLHVNFAKVWYYCFCRIESILTVSCINLSRTQSDRMGQSRRYRGTDAGPPATMPAGGGFVFVGHGAPRLLQVLTGSFHRNFREAN